jgi:hypothetical protein
LAFSVISLSFLGFLCCYRLDSELIDCVLEACFYTYILVDISACYLSVKANQHGFKVMLMIILVLIQYFSTSFFPVFERIGIFTKKQMADLTQILIQTEKDKKIFKFPFKLSFNTSSHC